MSSIELSPNVTLLSDFNIDGALRELCINPADKFKVAAIDFRLKSLKEKGNEETIATPEQTPFRNLVDNLPFRLELLDSHRKPFFLGKKCNYQALLLAVILDDFIVNIQIDDNEEGDFDSAQSIIKNIPNSVVSKASDIFDGAADLSSIRISLSDGNQEALFLAHVNWIEDLDNFLNDFDEKSEDELIEMRDALPDVNNFANPKTELGQTLLNFVQDIERKIPDFDGSKLIESLAILPQSFESLVIKFIFRELKKEIDLDTHDKYEATALETLAKVEYKLSLFSSYAPEFFGGSSYDRESLILAALADNLISEANQDAENGKFDFDSDILISAYSILEQANELNNYDQCLPHEVEYESLFMAHLYAASELYSCIENADSVSLKDLQKVKEDFSQINKFIADESAIGKKLRLLMIELDEEIYAKLPSADIVSLSSRRALQAPTP